jgi:predicted GNAT family N-acyltransferase
VELSLELASRVKRASSGDLAELAALRVEQGWYGSEALLRAIHTWDHGRHFILRASALGDDAALDPATIIAATSAIMAGPVAVIGNVITRPGLRGRGLGHAVMSATLAWLRETGARSVLLDATSAGQPLYQKVGFVAQERSWIAHAPLASLDLDTLRKRTGATHVQLRAMDDLPVIAALDQAAFGGDRLELLRLVASASDCWLYTAGGAGEPDGYLLVRALEPPRTGVRIGPWVAKTAEVGAALLAAALHPDAPWLAEIASVGDPQVSDPPVSFSTSAASVEALSLFRAIGGTLELDDVVMRLDFDSDISSEPGPVNTTLRPVAEHPEWLYSWLAAMVF